MVLVVVVLVAVAVVLDLVVDLEVMGQITLVVEAVDRVVDHPEEKLEMVVMV